MSMNEIENNYANVVKSFVTEFEKKTGLKLDCWIGNEIGDVARFGDLLLNLDEIRYAVHYNLSKEDLFHWQEYNATFPGAEMEIGEYTRIRTILKQANVSPELKELLYFKYMEVKNDAY